MKKIIIFLLFVGIFSSCQKFLDEVPKDFIPKVKFYKNQADADAAIAGVYSTFGTDYFGIKYFYFLELHADFLNGYGSFTPMSNFGILLDQNAINDAGQNWLTFYQAINRANAVLDNVPKISNMSDDSKTRILAEAHFLRAMAYFNLVRGWGPVPIKITESVDITKLASPREPESKVYDLIIADALAAETDLPLSVGNETERASKWTAKMLLAQLYLTIGNWSQAAEKANDIIENGNFTLVTVKKADDFYKIFATETNSEDIMSVHHSSTKQSNIQPYLHRPNTPPYNYGSAGYTALLPLMTSFIGNSWDSKDLRKNFNLFTKYLGPNGDTVSLPATFPVLFKKYITDPNGLRIYSIPIYRYTEAFLIYAEASAMADGTPSELALNRLNMIKRRAYGYDPNVTSPVDYLSGMSKEAFRDTVLKERAYEFLIEGRRWWDLKRTGKVKEAMAKVGKDFIPERLFWPIPTEEINNNPAIGQANQNPGY